MKIAKGEFFAFIDSDDWVNIDDFENFVKELKKLDCDLVITNYTRELVFSEESIKFEYNKKIAIALKL